MPIVTSCPGASFKLKAQLGSAPAPRNCTSEFRSQIHKRSPSRTLSPIPGLICQIAIALVHTDRRGGPEVGDTPDRPGLSTTWIVRSSSEALQMPRCFCLGTGAHELWGF